MLSALCLVTSVHDVRLHMLLFSKLGAHPVLIWHLQTFFKQGAVLRSCWPCTARMCVVPYLVLQAPLHVDSAGTKPSGDHLD